VTDEIFQIDLASEFTPDRNGLFFPDAEILQPTWDHAFKALFLNHPELTLRFVNDFFEFDCPIIDLTFLTNDIEPKNHAGKSVRLDVALKLANGVLIDLEMQTSFSAGYLRRCVFYNSMLLVSQTKSGASYKRQPSEVLQSEGKFVFPSDSKDSSLAVEGQTTEFLPNVFSLTLLNDRLPQKSSDKFRHSYQLRDGDDYLDKDCFRIDVVELPKLRERLEEVPERQRIWVRFFLARTYAEVKQLCEEDSIIKRACEVLEMVSKEDEMQDLARMIWQGEFAKRHEELLRQERDRAQAKLIAEGKAKLAEVAAKVEEAEAKVEEAEAKVEEAEARVIQTLSIAVRAMSATGQTPEAIAALLNLPYERVSVILHATESNVQSKE
jgi:hypothetical protein